MTNDAETRVRMLTHAEQTGDWSSIPPGVRRMMKIRKQQDDYPRDTFEIEAEVACRNPDCDEFDVVRVHVVNMINDPNTTTETMNWECPQCEHFHGGYQHNGGDV